MRVGGVHRLDEAEAVAVDVAPLDEELRDAFGDACADGLDVCCGWAGRRQRLERVVVKFEHAVEGEHGEVHVQVEGGAKALDDRDCAAPPPAPVVAGDLSTNRQARKSIS